MEHKNFLQINDGRFLNLANVQFVSTHGQKLLVSYIGGSAENFDLDKSEATTILNYLKAHRLNNPETF